MPRLLAALLVLLMFSPATAQDTPVPDPIADAIGDDDSGDDDSAFAPVPNVLPAVSDEEAEAAFKTLVDFQHSPWGPVLASLLTLAVFILRRTGALAKLPPAALPWVAAVLAMLADVASAAIAGAPLGQALAQGLMLGAAAVGFWELALKRVTTSRAAK